MPVRGAHDQIGRVVLTWPGVEARPHRFGGTEYRMGRREIGHIHGDHLVDIAFPRAIRDEIVAGGLAKPHHVLPDSGWVSFRIHETADVERAIVLLRRSYDLAAARQAHEGEAS